MTIFVVPLYSFVTYSFPIRLYRFIVVQYAMPPCIVSFFKLLIDSLCFYSRYHRHHPHIIVVLVLVLFVGRDDGIVFFPVR